MTTALTHHDHALASATRERQRAVVHRVEQVVANTQTEMVRAVQKSLAGDKPTADAVVRAVLKAALKTARDEMHSLARWSWESAVDLLGENLTAMHAALVLKGLGSDGLPLRESAADVAARQFAFAVFDPPSKSQVTQIVFKSTNAPDNLGWQARLERLSKKIVNKPALADAIAKGYSEGENVDQLTKRILPHVQGLTASARRIARTEGMRVAGHMQEQSFDQAGDAVVGYVLNEVLDDVTRPTHRERNGTVYQKGQKRPELPDEPNCRGWYSPKLASDEQLKQSLRPCGLRESAARRLVEDDKCATVPFGGNQGQQDAFGKMFNYLNASQKADVVSQQLYDEVYAALGKTPKWEDFVQYVEKGYAAKNQAKKFALRPQQAKVLADRYAQFKAKKLEATKKFLAKKAGVTHVVQKAQAQEIAARDQADAAAKEEAKALEAVREAGSKSLSTLDMKQVGPQAGSNPGGLYQDSQGVKWYVKQAKSADHAANEILASKLYQAAGINVVDVRKASYEGSDGTAARFVDGLTDGASKIAIKGDPLQTRVQQGFAVDAWLANWDVVGANLDNALVTADGKDVLRVDTGGALLYRAQGAPKGSLFGNEVTELNTLRDPSKNLQAYKVFGSISKQDIANSIDRVLTVDDATIKALVETHGPGDAAAKQALADKLIARKQYLKTYKEKLNAPKEATAPVPQSISKPSWQKTPEEKLAEAKAKKAAANKAWYEKQKALKKTQGVVEKKVPAAYQPAKKSWLPDTVTATGDLESVKKQFAHDPAHEIVPGETTVKPATREEKLAEAEKLYDHLLSNVDYSVDAPLHHDDWSKANLVKISARSIYDYNRMDSGRQQLLKQLLHQEARSKKRLDEVFDSGAIKLKRQVHDSSSPEFTKQAAEFNSKRHPFSDSDVSAALKSWNGSSQSFRTTATRVVTQTPDRVKKLKDLNTALDECPVYKGRVYRGMSQVNINDVKDMVSKGVLTFYAPASSSISLQTATSFGGGAHNNESSAHSNVLITMDQDSGAFLGVHGYSGGSEREVVIRQGTRARIKEVIREGSLIRINCVQLHGEEEVNLGSK